MPLLHATPERDRQPRTAAVEVRGVNPLEGSEWDQLVASHPGATVFHSSAWAKVLARTYGHRPFYFALSAADRLAALVPVMEVRSVITGRRGVCLPFSDSCAPLQFGEFGPGPVVQALRALAARHDWNYWEIRGGAMPDRAATPSVSFYKHTLCLRNGPEKLFASFDPSVRRAIRKAERSGVNVEIRSDSEAVSEYYRLHVRTRRRHGLPPQPVSFFRHIYEEIIATGMGSVVLASSRGAPVAGAVFFHAGKRALYKFGACDERCQDLRANNLVMWAGIRELSSAGYETLDFGRTSRHQDGLRAYKLGWGTVETTLNYFKLNAQAGTWISGSDRAAGTHNALFSRLPLRLNRLLGSVIYPHLD